MSDTDWWGPYYLDLGDLPTHWRLETRLLGKELPLLVVVDDRGQREFVDCSALMVLCEANSLRELPHSPVVPVIPAKVKRPVTPLPQVVGWPFTAQEAQQRQRAAGTITRALDLGDGVTMTLVRIPAGTFVMGDPAGAPDEKPRAAVTIARPFSR